MSNRNESTVDDGPTGQRGAGLDQIKNTVRGLVDRSQEQAGHIRDRAVEVKDQVLTRSNAVVDLATTFIRANPLASVGIAFGVGYVGMRLFRR